VTIEFKHRGTIWRTDTPQEAVALRNELEKSDRVCIPMFDWMDENARYWTPDRFMDVIGGIDKLQHRFLAAILETPRIYSAELTKQLGLESEVALAGVISGLSKQLKQIGIESGQTFEIEVEWTGKKKTRTFILDDFFKSAGVKQNWPEAWADELKEGDFGGDLKTGHLRSLQNQPLWIGRRHDRFTPTQGVFVRRDLNRRSWV